MERTGVLTEDRCRWRRKKKDLKSRVEGQSCEVFIASNWLAEGAGGGEALSCFKISR